jgi:cellulose synthase (UDP-forming)
MNLNLKIIGVVAAVTNVAYIFWLSGNFIGPLGGLLFLAELLLASLALLFLINHWKQAHKFENQKQAQGSVDIFLTIVNEPLELFEKTLRAAMAVDYLKKSVYVLDDGGNRETLKLCQKYGAIYLARQDKGYNKAGNLNFGLQQSTGDYILVLDSDQVVDKNIIKELLGYFDEDSKLALLSTRQSFEVPIDDFNQDYLFYEHMQAGKNIDNAAISCGSGVFYRRTALESVGGFQTWNIVEDLYTSYIFHARGFRSLYINKAYTRGLAPQDLSTIYKQRGTWALDTLRMFFRKSPLWFRGLTIKQRLHYIEMGWTYVVSAVAVPILFVLPIVAIFTNEYLITNPEQYLTYRLPSLLAVLLFYYLLSNRYNSTSQFWAGLAPVYLKALILSLLPVRIRYQVTNKLAGVGRRDYSLILPHLLLLTIALVVTTWRVYQDSTVTILLAVNLIWIGLMFFWFYPVIRKGLLLE